MQPGRHHYVSLGEAYSSSLCDLNRDVSAFSVASLDDYIQSEGQYDFSPGGFNIGHRCIVPEGTSGVSSIPTIQMYTILTIQREESYAFFF
jgi:hypothetical protein